MAKKKAKRSLKGPVPIKSGKPAVRRRKKSKKKAKKKGRKKAWTSCPSTIKKTNNPIPLKVLECRLDKLNRIVKRRGGKGL